MHKKLSRDTNFQIESYFLRTERKRADLYLLPTKRINLSGKLVFSHKFSSSISSH